MTPTPLRSACTNCGHDNESHNLFGNYICSVYACECPLFTPSPHSEQAAAPTPQPEKKPCYYCGGVEGTLTSGSIVPICAEHMKSFTAPTPKPISEWEEEFYRAFWYVNNNNLHERHGEGCGCRLGLARDIKAFITRTVEAAGREKEHKHGINTGNRYCDVCRGKLICNPHDPLIQCGVHCQYRPLKKEEENPDRELEGIVKQFWDNYVWKTGTYKGQYRHEPEFLEDFIRTQFPTYAAKQMEIAWKQGYDNGYDEGFDSGAAIEDGQKEARRDPVKIAQEWVDEGKKIGAEAIKRAAVKAIEDYFKGLIMIPDPQTTGQKLKEIINSL